MLFVVGRLLLNITDFPKKKTLYNISILGTNLIELIIVLHFHLLLEIVYISIRQENKHLIKTVCVSCQKSKLVGIAFPVSTYS